MPKSHKPRAKDERLSLTYATKRDDLEEVLGEMFARPEKITTPVALTPVAPTDTIQIVETLPPSSIAGRPTPVVMTGAVPTGGVATPPITTPVGLSRVRATPVAPMGDITPVDTTASLVTAPTRPLVVHKCVLAQDGHSRTEEALYQILWRNGKRVSPDDAYRITQIPQSALAQAMQNMTTKNVRMALDRLVDKLSIEEEASFVRGNRTSRIWRVYSYGSILRRREAAGLTHIVRDKGVRFVDPAATPVRTTRVLLPNDPETTGVAPTVSTPVAPTKTTPVVPTRPSLLEELSVQENTTTTTDGPVQQLAKLLNIWITLDDEAIQMLWQACIRGTPDCTPEEIDEFARTKLSLIQSGKIDNPTGLLIRQVPKFFENGGSLALKQRRESIRRRREEEQHRQQELRRQQRQILDDPNATEEDKEWARQMLLGDE